MMIKILIAVAIVVAVFFVIVSLQPSEGRITRERVMPVPGKAVFEQVNDFHKWQTWSPWAKRDPAAKNRFEGAASGKGAIFAWEGNKEVGAGRMTILESRPAELVRIKLEFFKPFASVSDAEFAFKPEGNQTKVTWTMTGKRPFMAKMFCMFVDMDKMVGGDFEKGLAGMESEAQKSAKM
ncbi:MAG TPA: SRPBCC family protein [Verrucomicrobiae bacterium]|nr:SRPBCC family protein [Verrucomicrobiae bacterium]